jgi:hypothetical protein
VVVDFVPWAENQSWFTYDFEQQVAYLAQRADKTTLSIADADRLADCGSAQRARRST